MGSIVVLSLIFAATVHAETSKLPGISEPVEIVRDSCGISHIYAKNQKDLFFAQGFNVARDRLFQLEMWRRRATGTLAELIGPAALRADTRARLLRPRVDMDAELAHYHPDGKEIITSFVAGINAARFVRGEEGVIFPRDPFDQLEEQSQTGTETGATLAPEASRRNVLVRGVPLNDLIKQRFWVGEVEMEGIRLCQPCKYLARIADEPGVLPGLVNRGGLRARVLGEGVIRVGDTVRSVL